MFGWTLDEFAKIAQIAFYLSTALVAWFTYYAAIKGWLNTVNTEYQKRVMDRLAKLGEDLAAEFDCKSDAYWINNLGVADMMRFIYQQYEEEKVRRQTMGGPLTAESGFIHGLLVTKDVRRLDLLFQTTLSDPFIPENIREAALDFLKNRRDVFNSIYIDVFKDYGNEMLRGEHPLQFDSGHWGKMYTKVNQLLIERGCSFDKVEIDMHRIRGLIQDHFESFNPHRRWWWDAPPKRAIESAPKDRPL